MCLYPSALSHFCQGGLLGLIISNSFIRIGHFSLPITGKTSNGTKLLFLTPMLAHFLTAFCSICVIVAMSVSAAGF